MHTSLSRLTAVLLFGLVVAAFISLTVGQAWRLYSENVAKIEEDRVEIGRILARRDEARVANKAAVIPTGASDRLLMSVTNPSAAVAQLQGSVAAQAKRLGVTFQSANVLQPSEMDGYQLIGVSVRLKGNQEKVFQLLHALETQVPYNTIRNANIEVETRTGATTAEDILNVQIDVLVATSPGR